MLRSAQAWSTRARAEEVVASKGDSSAGACGPSPLARLPSLRDQPRSLGWTRSPSLARAPWRARGGISRLPCRPLGSSPIAAFHRGFEERCIPWLRRRRSARARSSRPRMPRTARSARPARRPAARLGLVVASALLALSVSARLVCASGASTPRIANSSDLRNAIYRREADVDACVLLLHATGRVGCWGPEGSSGRVQGPLVEVAEGHLDGSIAFPSGAVALVRAGHLRALVDAATPEEGRAGAGCRPDVGSDAPGEERAGGAGWPGPDSPGPDGDPGGHRSGISLSAVVVVGVGDADAAAQAEAFSPLGKYVDELYGGVGGDEGGRADGAAARANRSTLSFGWWGAPSNGHVEGVSGAGASVASADVPSGLRKGDAAGALANAFGSPASSLSSTALGERNASASAAPAGALSSSSSSSSLSSSGCSPSVLGAGSPWLGTHRLPQAWNPNGTSLSRRTLPWPVFLAGATASADLLRDARRGDQLAGVDVQGDLRGIGSGTGGGAGANSDEGPSGVTAVAFVNGEGVGGQPLRTVRGELSMASSRDANSSVCIRAGRCLPLGGLSVLGWIVGGEGPGSAAAYVRAFNRKTMEKGTQGEATQEGEEAKQGEEERARATRSDRGADENGAETRAPNPAAVPLDASTILVTAPLDAASLFHERTASAEQSGAPLAALLVAARMLGALQRSPAVPAPSRRVAFAAVAGDTWGALGARRLLYDTETRAKRMKKMRSGGISARGDESGRNDVNGNDDGSDGAMFADDVFKDAISEIGDEAPWPVGISHVLSLAALGRGQPAVRVERSDNATADALAAQRIASDVAEAMRRRRERSGTHDANDSAQAQGERGRGRGAAELWETKQGDAGKAQRRSGLKDVEGLREEIKSGDLSSGSSGSFSRRRPSAASSLDATPASPLSAESLAHANATLVASFSLHLASSLDADSPADDALARAVVMAGEDAVDAAAILNKRLAARDGWFKRLKGAERIEARNGSAQARGRLDAQGEGGDGDAQGWLDVQWDDVERWARGLLDELDVQSVSQASSRPLKMSSPSSAPSASTASLASLPPFTNVSTLSSPTVSSFPFSSPSHSTPSSSSSRPSSSSGSSRGRAHRHRGSSHLGFRLPPFFSFMDPLFAGPPGSQPPLPLAPAVRVVVPPEGFAPLPSSAGTFLRSFPASIVQSDDPRVCAGTLADFGAAEAAPRDWGSWADDAERVHPESVAAAAELVFRTVVRLAWNISGDVSKEAEALRGEDCVLETAFPDDAQAPSPDAPLPPPPKFSAAALVTLPIDRYTLLNYTERVLACLSGDAPGLSCDLAKQSMTAAGGNAGRSAYLGILRRLPGGGVKPPPQREAAAEPSTGARVTERSNAAPLSDGPIEDSQSKKSKWERGGENAEERGETPQAASRGKRLLQHDGNDRVSKTQTASPVPSVDAIPTTNASALQMGPTLEASEPHIKPTLEALAPLSEPSTSAYLSQTVALLDSMADGVASDGARFVFLSLLFAAAGLDPGTMRSLEAWKNGSAHLRGRAGFAGNPLLDADAATRVPLPDGDQAGLRAHAVVGESPRFELPPGTLAASNESVLAFALPDGSFVFSPNGTEYVERTNGDDRENAPLLYVAFRDPDDPASALPRERRPALAAPLALRGNLTVLSESARNAVVSDIASLFDDDAATLDAETLRVALGAFVLPPEAQPPGLDPADSAAADASAPIAAPKNRFPRHRLPPPEAFWISHLFPTLPLPIEAPPTRCSPAGGACPTLASGLPTVCVGFRNLPGDDGRGWCLPAAAEYAPAYSTLLRFEQSGSGDGDGGDAGRWTLDDAQVAAAEAWAAARGWPADPLWAESNWPQGVPSLISLQQESAAREHATAAVGAMATVLAAAAAYLVQRLFAVGGNARADADIA